MGDWLMAVWSDTNGRGYRKKGTAIFATTRFSHN